MPNKGPGIKSLVPKLTLMAGGVILRSHEM